MQRHAFIRRPAPPSILIPSSSPLAFDHHGVLRVPEFPRSCATVDISEIACGLISSLAGNTESLTANTEHDLAQELLCYHLGLGAKVEPPLPPVPAFLQDADISPLASPDIIPNSAPSTMAKKRRSLQTLFTSTSWSLDSTFTPPSSPTRRARSHSATVSSESVESFLSSDSAEFGSLSSLPDLPLLEVPSRSSYSPPPDLLDDDPFADLSPAPSLRLSRPPPLDLHLSASSSSGSLLPPPRSPLSQSVGIDAAPTRELHRASSFASLRSLPASSPVSPTEPSRPPLTRPRSSTHVRPAYTRPAFTSRPSLPSLNALARSQVVVPQVRKGSVGAHLPLEPWDRGAVSPRPSRSSPEMRRHRHLRRPTELSTIRDSRMILSDQSTSGKEGCYFVNDPQLDGGAETPADPDTQYQCSSESASTPDDSAAAEDTINAPALLHAVSDPCYSFSAPSCPVPPAASEFPGPYHPCLQSYPEVLCPRPHTRSIEADLLSTLEYDYANAVTQLSRTPSPGGRVVHSPPPSGRKRRDEDVEPGTSAETIRTLASLPAHPLQRSDSDVTTYSAGSADSESDSPLSPSFYSSTPSSSSGHSRSTSATSSDYGEYIERSDDHSDLDEEPFSPFGIPWPSYSSPRMSYDMLSEQDFPLDANDITERFSRASLSRQVSSSSKASTQYDSATEGFDDMEEAVDGTEGGRRDPPGRYPTRSDRNGNHSQQSYGNGHANGGGNGFGDGHGGNGGSGGRRGRDDDRGRRPDPQSTTSEEESSEEESSDEEDIPVRGAPVRARTLRSDAHAHAHADDDVPLAQQIPTALKAQRTIRRQVRDELDQRRHERTLRGRDVDDRRDALARAARPAGAEARTMSGTLAASPPKPPRPERSEGRRLKTLPGGASSPIAVADLTQKLLGLQTKTLSTASASAPVPSPNVPPTTRSRRPSLDAIFKPFGRRDRSQDSRPAEPERPAIPPRAPQRAATTLVSAPAHAPDAAQERGRDRGLRPMRSIRRPGTAGGGDSVPPSPAPPTPVVPSGLVSRGASRRRPDEPPAFLSTPMPALPSAAAAGKRRSDEPPAAEERGRSMRAPSRPPSRRPSVDRERQTQRSSAELDRHESASISAAAARSRSRLRKPSVTTDPAHAPPLPTPTFAQAHAKAQTMWQQRVFIGNMQRFCLVEIGSSTSAGEVLQIVDSQGALDHGAGSGGWMVWEVSQDFGMERPIRNFELLSDVCGSWNTDKTVNLLVIKRTLLAPKLSVSAMPASSPICSGYVQYEYKRGKWQKRWMELREHGVWLSKKDNAKDQTFLCSLSNFDAYYVTRVHKAPKPFVFAAKSTDSITFFENTSDYLHVFSTGEGEGKNWLEKILLARSYILYQERNVLSSGTGSSALHRAGTRAQAGQRPAQPLVDVNPSKNDVPTSAVGFQPGSLLAKRIS